MEDIFSRIELLFREKYKDWDGGEQFKGSGERLRRLIDEMCWSREEVEEEVEHCLKAVFDEPYNEMLTARPINVWTFCPHHILPCNFKVHIGYVPNGKVLGLSKFTRIAVARAKMPIMQEQYTRELADTLWEGLVPDGLGVYVIGKHGCMGCRGVNQEVDIITSTLKGSMYADSRARGEFFALCRI